MLHQPLQVRSGFKPPNPCRPFDSFLLYPNSIKRDGVVLPFSAIPKISPWLIHRRSRTRHDSWTLWCRLNCLLEVGLIYIHWLYPYNRRWNRGPSCCDAPTCGWTAVICSTREEPPTNVRDIEELANPYFPTHYRLLHSQFYPVTPLLPLSFSSSMVPLELLFLAGHAVYLGGVGHTVLS